MGDVRVYFQDVNDLDVVTDIEEPDYLTTEEACQKRQTDRLLRLAEEKQTATRRETALLRRQYKRLLSR